MRWLELRLSMDCVASGGSDEAEVRGVQYDSRRVTQGDVFVAMRGGSTDGNKYMDAAVKRGAAAVVTDSAEMFTALRERQPELAVALVEHGRRALAEVSAEVFGHPEQTLKISAVTGTNGKTTTAFLLEQMLRSVDRKCVLLGTIETHIGDVVRESEHTTPESRDVLAVFAEGVRAGCTEAVMEMSSHALAQERVWGLPVDVAIFTNLTQDHLDYHGTMEAYAAAKARLFQGVGAAAPRVAVINSDDDAAPLMLEAAKHCGKVWTYGVGRDVLEDEDEWVGQDAADFYARHVMLSANGTSFELSTPFGEREVESRLVGMVNVYNLLAAMAAAMDRAMSLDDVVQRAASVKPVPGRFETVPNEVGVTVVVDYAHTDDALRNLIEIARGFVGTGRVITMFGCGGDRDKTKRPKMGRAAAAGSDLVVVTSDNPRSEEPMSIMEEVLAGVHETDVACVVEVDRHVAIEKAIRSANPGDIVLLAGKGHEKVQIFADGAVPFDDVAEAERVLRAMEIEGTR